MKKIISLVLVIVLMLSMGNPVKANGVTNIQKNEGKKLSLTQLTINDEVVDIPIVIEEIEMMERSKETENIKQEKINLYIPITKEGKEYNEKYINSLQYSKGSGTSTDSYPDPKNYLTATTYIYYTISGAYFDNVWCDDLMIKIDRVAISKDKMPESVGSGGILWGIGSPSVRVVCNGVSQQGGLASGNQSMISALSWGTTGISTPSSWVSVMRGAYSDLYNGFATFTFDLVYNTGTVNCSYTHSLAK